MSLPSPPALAPHQLGVLRGCVFWPVWVLTSPLSSPGQFLFERVEGISRATIVDLDAHQVSAPWGLGSSGPPPSAPLHVFPISFHHTTYTVGLLPLETSLSPKADLCYLHPALPLSPCPPSLCWRDWKQRALLSPSAPLAPANAPVKLRVLPPFS